MGAAAIFELVQLPQIFPESTAVPIPTSLHGLRKEMLGVENYLQLLTMYNFYIEKWTSRGK